MPGFAYPPQYADTGGVRLAWVEAGPPDGEPVLLLHGEPSWSFLYRTVMAVLAEAGLHAIAVDLAGFGRSDKPADIGDHSYARHVEWIRGLAFDRLDLRGLTLVGQDWGGLIGLRLVAEHPDRFARVVVANGFLPAGQTQAALAFRVWRAFARYSPVFPIGRIVAQGCVSKLTPAERAAYDAPFPSAEFKVGARVFPELVPTEADDPAMPANRAAWEALGKWQKPFLALFGKDDPILGKADGRLIRHVPGAAGQPHERIWGGHFVQEDRGDYLAEAVVRWKA